MPLNGRLPASDLGYITGTGHRILRELVPQTVALRAAFEARFGRPLTITDSYRDYDAQVRVKAAKGYLAATPGTSNHGWARAIDFGSYVNRFGSKEHEWMRANAPRFGWHHPSWARITGSKPEAWHWEASLGAVPVTNYRDFPGVTIPDLDHTVPDPLEEDMPSPEEIAAAVWKHPLGPLSGLDAQDAWVHLLAVRLTGEATAQALAPISAQAGEATIGPAPLSTFVADTRVDAMRALDILRGLAAQVGALQGALGAVGTGAGVDPAMIAEAAERGARAALANLTLTASTD